MKRYSSSDGPFASVSSPNEEEKSSRKEGNPGYSREFQAMLDSLEEEDMAEEQGRSPSDENKKKMRRLTFHQVKALERKFELENKLEPEKKLKLAKDLGLQPRQVAIWFQNRRARWKIKQLEKDYGSLKASYEALQLDYTSLEQENEALTQKPLQLNELKSKAMEETNANSSSQSAKEDLTASEFENNASVQSQHHLDFSEKNEANWIQLSDSRSILGNGCQIYQPHLVKIEDHGIFSAEETCNFFSVDQAPTLPWYLPDQY